MVALTNSELSLILVNFHQVRQLHVAFFGAGKFLVLPALSVPNKLSPLVSHDLIIKPSRHRNLFGNPVLP